MHIALILDGNRRWAQGQKLPKLIGHKRGVENLKRLLPVFTKNQINWLTVFALSTENLASRSELELKNLFQIIEKFGCDLTFFQQHQIRVRIFGSGGELPESTQTVLQRLVQKTQKNTKLNFNLAINYGGRNEIIRAAQKLRQTRQVFSEENLNRALDSRGQPDPDLLIRTGGQQRLSNFLPWQLTYTELYFTTKMWPEFREVDLNCAIKFFHKQQRNFGK